MYHFKMVLKYLISLMFCVSGFIANGSQKKVSSPILTRVPVKKASAPTEYYTVTLSYFSWGESITLQQANLTDQAHCNLLGNSIGLAWEKYYKPRTGYLLEAAALLGVADIGGTQSTISYSVTNQSWNGFRVSARFAYRFSRWVISSIGPTAIYRTLKFDPDPNGIVVNSSSNLIYGATLGLSMRLTDTLQVDEEIGAFAANAITYWSLGLGYKF